MSGLIHNSIMSNLLEQLLRRPIHVIQANQISASKARAAPRELIVDSPRVLVIRTGRLEYVVEEQPFYVRGGQAVFVPALVRRHWRCLTRSCDLAFFSFESDPPLHMSTPPLLAESVDAERESEAIARVIAANEIGRTLVAEGEIKAMLARVLCDATPAVPATADSVRHPRGIQEAMIWLERHLADPHPLRDLHERADLSAWHFRRMFRRWTGKSPGEHLLELRMRSARFRLSQGHRLVKDVAREVGYDDALYFSRCYRRFWGHSPRAMRDAIATPAS